MFIKPVFVNVRLLVRLAIVATAMTILIDVAGGPPQPAIAATSGLAYDEVTRFNIAGMTGSAANPDPGSYANGSFAADFQAAVSAAATPKPHGGMFGAIINAGEAAKSAMSLVKSGSASTEYYWNGLRRTDDPGHQTATIYRPDLHQTIDLDLAKKTYTIVDTSTRVYSETPIPYQPPAHSQGPQPSPVPGTAKVSVTVSTTALGAKTLDGQPSQGYKMEFKLASTHATGSCANGSFGTTMVEFVSNYDEPQVTSPSGKPAKLAHRANPETMAVKPGCKPTFTARVHKGPTPPEGKLALWENITLNAGMGTSQGASQGAGFSTILERGNVRALGPNDKGLFEIPAGFTQATASPSP
ncbi:MAG: hypothetical protein M3Z41_03740 [Candidatus Eremiobacteraeota bacterium]|nr:hypothetical protein [Candidatus Eremiobacteraeota bacterium]